MNIANWGALALGIVVAYLVRMFVRRFRSYSPKALSAVVSILLGGTVVRFLANDPDAVWYYPIGLFAGFVIYTIVALAVVRRQPEDYVCYQPTGVLIRDDDSPSKSDPPTQGISLPDVLLEPPPQSNNDKTL